MSTYINHIGTYNDHHKELTINANSGDVADIVRSFMSDAEDIKPEETHPIAPFKYIHPSVTDKNKQLQITLEIQNLVRNLPLPEVCRYMRKMYREKRIYLNVKAEAMFEELHRLGLPDEETPGYSIKNFKNYFNMND